MIIDNILLGIGLLITLSIGTVFMLILLNIFMGVINELKHL